MINQNRKKGFSIYQLAFTGMMAAVVFVATAVLHIDIPLPTGKTMLSLGNAMCVLCGLLLGPIYGGLAAGIGSFCYDLMDPIFIAKAPITFIFKFVLGFVCGIIAYAGHKGFATFQRRIIASISGAISYIILYLGYSILSLTWVGSAFGAAIISVIPKIAASSTNAILAVVIAVPLSMAIQKALGRSHLSTKLDR